MSVTDRLCDMCGDFVHEDGWVVCQRCSDRDDDLHKALSVRLAELEDALRQTEEGSRIRWYAQRIAELTTEAGRLAQRLAALEAATAPFAAVADRTDGSVPPEEAWRELLRVHHGGEE